MIFADKLICLRKNSGWSQEEFASMMGVSRQSVSKWEGAQSIPDLDKMVKISQLFGVSTDYLLKDDIEETEVLRTSDDSKSRVVSVEEANDFMEVKDETSKMIGLATSLLIVSPIPLFLFGTMSESPVYNLSEGAAASISFIVLIIFAAIAVAMYILSGSKTSKYEYLEKEVFELAYGVEGIVNDRREKFRQTYTKHNMLGTILCILAALPVLITGVNEGTSDVVMSIGLSSTLAIVSFGVYQFIRAGVVWESFHKLLQTDDYTVEKKTSANVANPIITIYWVIIIAVYLGYSFITFDWGRSWIIPTLGGILTPAVIAITNLVSKGKE